MTGASQFHRAALGVVGPELAAALHAGPGLLGAANGAFFLALLLLQVPVGLALDRIGPRRTVAWLALPAALGALGQALAPDAAWFLAARFVLGLGCAASFMASVVLCARWHAGPGLTTALARVFALSQGGVLLAGAPFAAAAEASAGAAPMRSRASSPSASPRSGGPWCYCGPAGAGRPLRQRGGSAGSNAATITWGGDVSPALRAGRGAAEAPPQTLQIFQGAAKREEFRF